MRVDEKVLIAAKSLGRMMRSSEFTDAQFQELVVGQCKAFEIEESEELVAQLALWLGEILRAHESGLKVRYAGLMELADEVNDLLTRTGKGAA